MSQPVLLKVYGNLKPVSPELYNSLCAIAATACPAPDEPPIQLEGDLLTLAFEGISFPTAELIATLEKSLTGSEQGKIDVLDLAEWQLERYAIDNGRIKAGKRPLNDVLAWSGH